MTSKTKYKIAVARDRSHIRLSWEINGYWKEVKIPITEYYESRLR